MHGLGRREALWGHRATQCTLKRLRRRAEGGATVAHFFHPNAQVGGILFMVMKSSKNKSPPTKEVEVMKESQV